MTETFDIVHSLGLEKNIVLEARSASIFILDENLLRWAHGHQNLD